MNNYILPIQECKTEDSTVFSSDFHIHGHTWDSGLSLNQQEFWTSSPCPPTLPERRRRCRLLPATTEGQRWLYLPSSCASPKGWWRGHWGWVCAGLPRRHKPSLAKAYRGPFRIKSQGTTSYVLEGRNVSEDRVNWLKPFNVWGDEEAVDLQLLPWRGQPARVAEPASLTLPTPGYSLPEDEFLPLASDTPNNKPKETRSCRVPPGHWRKLNL